MADYLSEDYKSLLIDAFLSSEDLIQYYNAEFYQTTSLSGLDIPFLNIERFQELVIQDLADKEDVDLTIDIGKLPFPNNLYALLEYNINAGELYITTTTRINVCWTRFALLKELCQVIIDFKSFKSGNNKFFRGSEIYSQITELQAVHSKFISEGKSISLDISDKNFSEFLAFFMAVNLIFPKHHRPEFKKLVAEAKANKATSKHGITLYDIAYAYRMPEYIIKFFIGVIHPCQESWQEALDLSQKH